MPAGLVVLVDKRRDADRAVPREIVTVSSVKQAVDLARCAPVSTLLCAGFYGARGMGLVRRLRGAVGPSTQIVVLAGRYCVEVGRLFLDAGADLCVPVNGELAPVLVRLAAPPPTSVH